MMAAVTRHVRKEISEANRDLLRVVRAPGGSRVATSAEPEPASAAAAIAYAALLHFPRTRKKARGAIVWPDFAGVIEQ